MRSIHPSLVLLLLLAACGSQAGGPPAEVEQDVLPVAATTVEGGARLRDLATLHIGIEDGATQRAILRFALPVPPPGRRLARASLVVTQRPASALAYQLLGDVIVQSIDAGEPIQPDAGTVQGTTLGTLSDAADAGPKTLDLTDHAQSLLGAGAGFMDLRLQFPGDIGSYATPLVVEFDKEPTGSGYCGIRFYWQLAY